MRYAELTSEDIANIKSKYESDNPRRQVQNELAEAYNVHSRTIRKWATRLRISVEGQSQINSRILIYDIETPRLRSELWWSGKQYVNGNDIVDEPRIISISWKWYGEDKVHAAHWDLESQDDKEMMKLFLEDYNQADVIVGINNDRFDNRWVNARALKHKLQVNSFPRSVDVQKQAKRHFRLPSYSLKYLCGYFDVPHKKLEHEGIIMWRMIQYGTMEERKEYMQKMIEYNVGDIMATEAVFMRLLPFLNLQAHLGVLDGNQKYSCPLCGETEQIELVNTTSTRAGTIQHIMRCKKDGHTYKISNREYLNWLNGN